MSPQSPWYTWCLLSWPPLPREGQPPGFPSGVALAQLQRHGLLLQASMSSLPSPYPTNAVNCGRTGTRATPGREGHKTSNNSVPTTLALFWQRPDYSAWWERARVMGPSAEAPACPGA